MTKYIAERHIATSNGIVKPGEEIEIAKGQEKKFKENGWIKDIPKKADTSKNKDTDSKDEKVDADGQKSDENPGK